MDMFEEIAARRWQETETDVSKITDVIFANNNNEGWAVASIYSYNCFAGYGAYSVTLWKSSGTKNGFAIVQIKGMLVRHNTETDQYELVNIVKIL
jgi:hypothetical protein